jgi:hypothetical protein
MMWFKQTFQGMNPWIPAFAVNIMFQFMRHSPVDGYIFLAATILMILDWKKLLPFHFGDRPVFRLKWIVLVIVASASVLYASPRHSLEDSFVLMAIVPFAVYLIYYRDEELNISPTPAMRRTQKTFVTLAVVLVVLELAAYIVSDQIHNSTDFPTISFLISPTLELPWVRFVFLAIWMALGVALTQVLRGRKVIEALDHEAQVRAAIDDIKRDS